MRQEYNKKLVGLSRELRKNMTPEEKQLWYQFLKKLPVTVNRQKNIGDFIVDFYISSANLVIEIDGRQHKMKDNAEADRLRDEELERRGLKVLRYNNQSVRNNFNAVCMDILNNLGLKVEDLDLPSPGGEGGPRSGG